MSHIAEVAVKKRTLRRRQKRQLILEAQQDIENIERRIAATKDKTNRKGLVVLLDLLYIHCYELINSEV